MFGNSSSWTSGIGSGFSDLTDKLQKFKSEIEHQVESSLGLPPVPEDAANVTPARPASPPQGRLFWCLGPY